MQEKFESNLNSLTNLDALYWQTIVTSKIHMIIQPNSEGKQGIYIGGLEGASDTKLLYRYNINSVQTVAALCPISYHNVQRVLYHNVIPVHMESDLSKYFDNSYNFINQALNCGNILIHCISGTERAPVYAMAYLMRKYNYNVEKAYDFVEKQCPFSKPNSQFMKQLLLYEKTLNIILKAHYTIRDNNEITILDHLTKPGKQKIQSKSDKFMQGQDLNLVDIQKEINAQARWLENFQYNK